MIPIARTLPFLLFILMDFYVNNYCSNLKIAAIYEFFSIFLYLCRCMKKILNIFAFILLSCYTFQANGQTIEKEKVIKGFCGGMMLHTGYQFGGDNPFNYNPKGATFGIGGVAKIQFTKHFRAGFEGYFSTVGLHENVMSGSHNKMFWSGGLVDWFWKCGKFYPYIGATVGGGMETSFYMFKGDKNNWEYEEEAVFRKQPFGCIDPFIGVDYAVGEALRLTLKADWVVAINSEGLNRPMGPRIYFGFIFAH